MNVWQGRRASREIPTGLEVESRIVGEVTKTIAMVASNGLGKGTVEAAIEVPDLNREAGQPKEVRHVDFIEA